MLKRILAATAFVLILAVLSGTALADYGYTSVSRIPMAYPFSVRVAFDGDGLPRVITDYPFEAAGADEMNLVYHDRSGGEAFTLNYQYSTGKTSIGYWDSSLFKEEPGEDAFRMIRNGEVTLADEITVNTAHFSRGTDWSLVYSSRENNYIEYSETTRAQGFNAMDSGGVKKSILYSSGEMSSVWMIKRNQERDLMVEYNAYGEIRYASVMQHGEKNISYNYDLDTGLFGGRPITELGFEESDLEVEALAARGTRTETAVRNYETQIVTDAKDMARTTVRVSGGLVTGIMIGIVLYYMIRRMRQNAKEKAEREKRNKPDAVQTAEKTEEMPEAVEPPRVMSSSNG